MPWDASSICCTEGAAPRISMGGRKPQHDSISLHIFVFGSFFLLWEISGPDFASSAETSSTSIYQMGWKCHLMAWHSRSLSSSAHTCSCPWPVHAREALWLVPCATAFLLSWMHHLPRPLPNPSSYGGSPQIAPDLRNLLAWSRGRTVEAPRIVRRGPADDRYDGKPGEGSLDWNGLEVLQLIHRPFGSHSP